MINVIEAETADDLFVLVANELLNTGRSVNPRGLKTLEIQNAFLILKNPIKNICNLPARDLNIDYLMAEMEWYTSGSLNVDDISKHSKFWTKLADTNGTVNSNYGFLCNKEKFAGKSQFEWCVDTLKKDIHSRQAVINYNQPRHKYEGNKDFVCTLSQHFIYRNGQLDCNVVMRSNDLIYGLSYDLPWFCAQQIRIANILGVKIGTYNHFATSLHVYEKHFKMIEDIACSSR